MASFDEEGFSRAVEDISDEYQRIDTSPTKDQLLGGFTVSCLILNRTIGTGIFVAPGKVLNGTGSVGASLLLWVIGGLTVTCGLLTWLEFGLSVPLRNVPGSPNLKSVPRSGGEKNYLEFVFDKPKFLTTCMYGVIFLLLGNLSGNGYAFGIYLMQAAGIDHPSGGQVIALALFVLTFSILLHILSRRTGILLNNIFAVVKVLLLIAIIILGLVKAGGSMLGGDSNAMENFKPERSFSANSDVDVVGVVNAWIYVFYSYSGMEQPFYVLSEVRRPRKTYPKYTIFAMLLTTALFVLTNLAYFCVIPETQQIGNTEYMASEFLSRLFGDQTGHRAMAALISISIFGNILVMTYTASRVKQEIAKEGILPFSLFFATCYTTPISWIRTRWQLSRRRSSSTGSEKSLNTSLEQAPIPALLLHWFTSVLLIAATAKFAQGSAYSILVELFSYVLVIGIGFVVSGALLYLKFIRRKYWLEHRNFHPWFDPLPALLYFSVCGFLLFASFAKPASDSLFRYVIPNVQWYVVPAIGQSAWFWGVAWYFCFRFYLWNANRQLVVTRVPYIVPDDEDPGQWIQKSELVDHVLKTMRRRRGHGASTHRIDSLRILEVDASIDRVV